MNRIAIVVTIALIGISTNSQAQAPVIPSRTEPASLKADNDPMWLAPNKGDFLWDRINNKARPNTNGLKPNRQLINRKDSATNKLRKSGK